MELSKLVEEILKITNESPYGWLDMDSVEAGEIWKLLNKELKQLHIGSVSGSCPQEVAENIVTELDAFGRKTNSVEYGLPIVDWDEKYEKCLQIVKDNYR